MKTDAKDPRDSNSLEQTMAVINKQFGEGSIMKLGNAKKMDVSVISTGSLALDLALGVG
jgi:recombination protein RecA